MFGETRSGWRLSALTIGLAVLVTWLAPAAEPTSPTDPVRIGMIGTLFRDVPEATVQTMMQPFGALMESQTGVSGLLVPSGDAESMGHDLATDKVQLGVFHGIEFAWARQKFPELQPLLIAVNQRPHLYAFLVVRADSPANEFADLKGQALALPHHTREHCRHFVQRRCPECDAQKFFQKITTPANVEEALDDVVDHVVQAAVVDGVSLDCYQRRKPGRFAKLKVVQQSEVFPAAVIAYRPGCLAEATLQRFRHGMLRAHQSLLGRQLLTLWKLTGFEAVPADYEQTLANIVKAYPPAEKDVK